MKILFFLSLILISCFSLTINKKLLTKKYKSTSQIIEAFNKDGFKIIRQIEFRGQRGILAESKTAFNLDTKEFKKGVYVEGNAFENGYLIGKLQSVEAEKLAVTYRRYVIPEILNYKFVKEHGDKQWFKVLADLFSSFFRIESKASFEKGMAKYPLLNVKSMDRMHSIHDKYLIELDNL